MTHGSLFSGIGGFDIAAAWAGWENVFACEIDPFCQKVLKYHFPNSTLYENIRTTDFTIWRGRIDVLSGGFPCQPFSTAGKRKGTEDDRYLWPEMLRAIREISPRWVVGENVLGIVNWNGGMVFEQVCADLEIEGYEVQPYVLPACGVGAPHRRDRVWFVSRRIMENPGSGRLCGQEILHQQQGRTSIISTSENRLPGNGQELEELASQNPVDIRCVCNQSEKESRTGKLRKPCPRNHERICGEEEAITYAYDGGLRGKIDRNRESRFIDKTGAPTDWSDFPTQPPIRCGNDGIPGELDGITLPSWRRESLKAYGNAVVPLVPLQIFNVINQYENLICN